MECPNCGGPMWDNRNRKKTPKSPDFRCKSQECGKVVWVPKPAASTSGSAGQSSGYTWRQLYETFARCHQLAVKVVGKDSPDRQAATATLFIQATRMGLKVSPPAAPPPPPPPPPSRDDFEDFPEALKDDDQDLF